MPKYGYSQTHYQIIKLLNSDITNFQIPGIHQTPALLFLAVFNLLVRQMISSRL